MYAGMHLESFLKLLLLLLICLYLMGGWLMRFHDLDKFKEMMKAYGVVALQQYKMLNVHFVTKPGKSLY